MYNRSAFQIAGFQLPFKLLSAIQQCSFENEDRSTKHPNLENEAPKSRNRSTQNSKAKHPKLENEAPKTRKRSTQISKTKHPKIENGAPKSWKRSTQNSKTRKHPNLETTVGWRTTTLSLAWRKPDQVEVTESSAPPKVHQSIPRSIGLLVCRGRAVLLVEPFFPAALLST